VLDLKEEKRKERTDRKFLSNNFLRKFSGDPPYAKFGSLGSNFA
jgi:hypothetical protein